MNKMFFMFKIAVILTVLVVLSESAKVNTISKCDNKTLQNIDRQFSTVYPIFSRVKLPVNDGQLRKYCTDFHQAMDSGVRYIRGCTGTYGPLMAKTIQTEYNREYNGVCKSSGTERRRRLVFSAGQCLNSVSNKVDKCGQNALDAILGISMAPLDDRVNMMCCHAYKFLKCMDTSLAKSKRCDNYQKRLRDDKLIDFIDGVCGGYFSGNTRCKRVIAETPIIEQYYAAPAPGHQTTAVKPRSIFMPMITLINSYGSEKCTVQMEHKMDQLVAELLTIGTPDPIPENVEQLKQWLNKFARNMPLMYSYANGCTSEFAQFLLKFMAPMALKSSNKMFGPGIDFVDGKWPGMHAYFEAAKCGNRAEDKMVTCFDNWIDRLEGIVQAPDMLRIRMSCCTAYEFRTCLVNATTSTQGCTQGVIDWAEQQVLDIAQPSIDFVCRDHWNVDQRCKALVSQIPQMDPKTYIRHKSIFMPVMKLLDSFPDVELE